jgi:hypothetical protein
MACSLVQNSHCTGKQDRDAPAETAVTKFAEQVLTEESRRVTGTWISEEKMTQGKEFGVDFFF